MQCRPNCGACCIAPSISSAIPGMPNGKAAGKFCVNLDAKMRCTIFESPARPTVCAAFKPSPETCGESQQDALDHLSLLERLSAPTNGD